jgi:phosphoglycolate phosphatase-like HAD superfamily hydrolase
MNRSRPAVSALVTDLDNTLFDWIEIWYRSIRAMLNRLAADSGVPEQDLESELRAVHREHGTPEYAFAIEELPSLRRKHPAGDLTAIYSAAIQAFREARREARRLYPTVRQTLQELKDRGCIVAAYTESTAFYTDRRLRHLGLDLLIDCVYSPADHDLPSGLTADQVRLYPAAAYQLRRTLRRHTAAGERKPSASVLKQIAADVGARAGETVYVGDSLAKDVAMAQQAGMFDVWARYGVVSGGPGYELLKRLTHWTEADIERERSLATRRVEPSYVLEHRFGELLDLFDFEPPRR